SVHLIFMMTTSTFLMEWAVRADGIDNTALRPLAVVKSLARNLAMNPIIVGIVTGGLIRIIGLPLPGFLLEVLDLVARCTGPLALIALGMGLVKYGFRGNLPPAATLTFLALIIMPATVLALQHFVQMPTLWFQVALLCASCPTGVNAYLIASYFRTGEGLATNTIVMALIGSVVTIPFWLWVGTQTG
ncbi:MAG: AEC family transporter, partial [Pseudomonadota bacterium]